MKTWNTAPLHVTLLTCSLVSALGCTSAYADEKKPYPRPGGSAAPSASASARPLEEPAKMVDGHKPWAPTLDVVLPAAPSEPPAKGDWASAPPAWDVRVTDPGCKAQRIREWYRLTCTYAQIEMISGSREDVTFGCTKDDPESLVCSQAWIIFPARRGDRRAVEFLTFSKWGLDPDSVLTEQFLEGDLYPSISLQGIRWDF